ncbi:ABC transporter permease [Spirochaetia bacterium]|nr:ABC transporter permease [Spirochaetia bacterium]
MTGMNNKKNFKTTGAFFLYVLPALVLYFLFKIWPILYSFILSFFDWNFVRSMRWVGLKNYAGMFFREEFQAALGNTFLYIAGLLPFFLVLPLLFAVMLTGVKSKSGENIYKALLFLPTILALSIICLVWMWMFNPNFGVLNNLFHLFGFDGFSWLSDKRTALFSIIFVSGWKFMGAHLILFYAGLLGISREYIEAATIDGASVWQVFWKIKWPLLSPTTIYIIVTSVIFAAERAFTPINILTKGGPANTSTNLSFAIYRFGFEYFNIGLASAAAIFTSILFLIITCVMMKTLGGYSYYEN